MTDDTGTGLEFRGDKLLNFSAQPYSKENLTKSLYTYQFKQFDGVTFNLDYATSGVDCNTLFVFSAYRVMPQRYDFRIIVRPVRKYIYLHPNLPSSSPWMYLTMSAEIIRIIQENHYFKL